MLICSLGDGGKENLLFLCICAEYEPNSPGSTFCIVSNGNKGIAILIWLQQEAFICVEFILHYRCYSWWPDHLTMII